MRFVFFVEGDTEHEVLSEWLGRWLNARLSTVVKVQVFNLRGNKHFLADIPKRARATLGEPGNDDIVACIGLLDLYRFPAFPKDVCSIPERYNWARAEVEKSVNRSKFHMYFAVHEFEASALSQSSIYDARLTNAIARLEHRPEEVNFDNPPAKRLDAIYRQKLNRVYGKKVDGRELFARLDPEKARKKCPYLRAMLDDLLRMAKDAGL